MTALTPLSSRLATRSSRSLLRRIALRLACLAVGLPAAVTAATTAPNPDPAKLVEDALRHYRGAASVATMRLTIHRPRWERTLTVESRTLGRSDAVFVITAPPKDAGNGTLKKGRDVWTYNPRVERVVKLPPSMMAQPWMGSDFSNEDLAKSDSIAEDYDHTLEGTETEDGTTVYVIRSVPKPGAPVVWGMQRLRIREDRILLSEAFYDEDLELVKTMTGSRIERVGGTPFPMVWVVANARTEDGYTRAEYLSLEFPASLPERLFTLTALKRPPGR